MELTDLNSMTGVEFHNRVDWHHTCKHDDTPVYYLFDEENWLCICQDDDNDDGLWRGEWDYKDECMFVDYDGRETPEEVLEMLCVKAQAFVAEEILEAMDGE